MGATKSCLCFTWHVNRPWRRNLNKIKGKETQGNVYKTLRCLLEERDLETFNILLTAVLEERQKKS